MDVTLVRFKDDEERRDFRVKGSRCLIGRQKTCDLPIPLSSISREHCEIVIKDGGVQLRDLGSRNGTYRNGERIEGVVALEPGDRVAIGPMVFTVQIDGEPEYVEPPLLEAPTATEPPARHASSSAPAQSAGAADDSDLSEMISNMSGEDSSVFDLDMYLDEDEDEKD